MPRPIAYSYLRVAKHIQDEFIEMFSNRMTPSAAKAYHEIKLTANIDDDMQTIKLLADAKTNPTDRQVYQIFDYWRTKHFGDRTENSIAQVVREMQNTFPDYIIEVQDC